MNEALETVVKSMDLLRSSMKDGQTERDQLYEFAHEILWDIRTGIEGMDYTYQEVENVRTKVIVLLKRIAKLES